MKQKGAHASYRSRIRKWIDGRFAVSPILNFTLFRRVEKAPWYYGAGAALVLLLSVLVGTGVFLALSYSPSTQMAHHSVVQVSEINVLGWFVRGLHYWSAGMMVVCIVYHMFRQIILGGYKPPREGMWLVGVGLFVLVITNAYIGYTLRWDESGAAGVRVALNIMYRVPWIGDALVRIVQGGEAVGTETLSRLYALHVIIVPLLLLALASYHIYLLICHGVTTPAERRRPMASAEQQRKVRERVKHSSEEGTDFYPFTAAKSGSFALAVFVIALILTVVFRAPVLGPHPNSLGQTLPKEEWWFHWISGLAALLPPAWTSIVYVGLPLLILLSLLVLPFFDRGPNRGARNRPVAVVLIAAIVIVLLALTGYRLKSPFTAWPRSDLPPIPANITLSTSAAEGRQLFVAYGCYNCHAIGGHGSGVGPNLTALDVRLSKWELINYIANPPMAIAMPAYQGIASAAELERLAEFVLVAQTFPRTYAEGVRP